MPPALKVVGILWLLAGLALVLNSSLCLVMWRFGGFRERIATSPGDGVFGVFRYYGMLAAVQLAGALLLVAGAVAVLRLRAYGRVLLQLACLVGIAFIIAFDLLCAWSASNPGQSAINAAFQTVFVVVLVVASLFFLAPPVFTVWFLGRADIQKAFHHP